MAAVDYFLKLDGIEGESLDDKHKGEIDLMSFSWGETHAAIGGATGGAGAGKVQFQDIHFTKSMDKASPNLFLKCANGQHIKEGVLTARKAGEVPQEFLKIRFTDLLISSYQTGGSGGVIPTDQFSLNFVKIEIMFTSLNPQGTSTAPVSAGWDVKTNKAV